MLNLESMGWFIEWIWIMPLCCLFVLLCQTGWLLAGSGLFFPSVIPKIAWKVHAIVLFVNVLVVIAWLDIIQQIGRRL